MHEPPSPQHSPLDALTLLAWKRTVFSLYRAVREAPDPRAAWETWRFGRDRLFKSHEQSPLPKEARESFGGLPFFPYDPAWRFVASLTEAEPLRYDITSSRDGTYSFTRFATARAGDVELEVYWLEAYGGGIFVPFRDATSGKTTYGAGRYLLDTVKGADLGTIDGKLILDFNFAYNPSCAYDPQWDCPLAPTPNWLSVPVNAGERYP
jgi:uncharacterized protein (DUF1684 family)